MRKPFILKKLFPFLLFTASIFLSGCVSKWCFEEACYPAKITAIGLEEGNEVWLRVKGIGKLTYTLTYAQLHEEPHIVDSVTIDEEGFLLQEGKRFRLYLDKPLAGREVSFLLKRSDGKIIAQGSSSSHTFVAANKEVKAFLTCLNEEGSTFHLQFQGLLPDAVYTFTIDLNFEEKNSELKSDIKGCADLWFKAPLEGGIAKVKLQSSAKQYTFLFPIGKTFIRFEADEEMRLFLSGSQTKK